MLSYYNDEVPNPDGRQEWYRPPLRASRLLLCHRAVPCSRLPFFLSRYSAPLLLTLKLLGGAKARWRFPYQWNTAGQIF